MNDFTPKELAYILVLQSILSSSEQLRTYPHEVVDNAMRITDILFDRMEARRKEKGAA